MSTLCPLSGVKRTSSKVYRARSKFLHAGMWAVNAMVAAIGSGDAFSNGRDFAAWLGRHAVNVRLAG
jgi:hypothetical protein